MGDARQNIEGGGRSSVAQWRPQERRCHASLHCLLHETGYVRCMEDRQHHFAYCVRLLGGTTAFARRLGIDERAIRRFINGERPISDKLLSDTAKALRDLAADANVAASAISEKLTTEPGTANR